MSVIQDRRLTQILRRLRDSAQPVMTRDLADGLGVSARTVERDIRLLRRHGLPIDGTRGRGGGVWLDATVPAATTPPTSMPKLPASPLIGREREMADLNATLDGLFEGRGGLVMLVGEPGIGKTRMTEELEAVAGNRGARVTRGACYEGGGAPPYWPWIQAIRSLLTEPSEVILTVLDTSAAVIAEIVPEIRKMLPELQPAPDVDPEQARFRLFDSITSFLNEIAASHPMVVVLDDLQWADRSSLDLLEFFARDISSNALLLIGGYRNVELSRRHPLSETLAAIARERGFQRIPLRGLERDDVGRLVEAVGDITLPPALINEIHDRTEGNPFFVAEVTRDLSREATVRDESFDPVEGFRIPDGVREVIGIRLNRLSEECNQWLRTAAVIGKEFELELLKRLIPGFARERFLAVLEEALFASIVEEITNSKGRCRFTHVLIQETLSEEFSAARRAGLHGEIGEALERLYADDVYAHADELAYHFAEADPGLGSPKLVRYSLMAGERALSTYAWDEALEHFGRGLVAKEGQPVDANKAALLFGLARAQSNTLERHRVYEAVDAVRPAFDYYVDAENVSAALAIAEYPFFSEVGPGLTQLLTEALKLVPPDSHHAGRLLARRGFLSIWGGSFETSRVALEQALFIARREDDTGLEISVLIELGMAYFLEKLEPQKCLEYCQKAIELGSSSDQGRQDFSAHWWAAVSHIALGDLKEASLYASSSSALAEKRTGQFGIVQCLFAEEAVTHLQGNWEAARDFSDRGLTVDHTDTRLVSNRTTLEYELGEFDRGDAYLERLVETMRNAPSGATLECSVASMVIGVAAHITGAARHFDVAEEAADMVLLSPTPFTFMAQLARTGLALIAVERGDGSSAGEQYDALKRWRITLTGLNLMCGHRVLGLLAQTLGRMDDAIVHFRDSLEFCRTAGARPELAWTSYDFADSLLQRGDVGDHSRAVSLVDQALAISTELSMRPLMERTVALQEKARLLPAGKPQYPAGLTPREVEVLRLVASSKSNAGIARELVLSVRTVERHISNIYGKTGPGGRANATAFAFTSGLMTVHKATE